MVYTQLTRNEQKVFRNCRLKILRLRRSEESFGDCLCKDARILSRKISKNAKGKFGNVFKILNLA